MKNTFIRWGFIIIGVTVSIATIFVAFANHIPEVSPSGFSDVFKDHPNSSAIDYLKSQGVVSGYPADKTIGVTFRPDNSINRAEFLTILMNSVMKNPTGKNCFKDVKDEWFAKYVCAAKKKGIVKGYPEGTFRPGQNINIAEAATMITTAFRLRKGTQTSADPWFKKYVVALEIEKAIPVSIDYPEKKISRGEMAEIIWRLKTDPPKTTKTYASLVSSLPNISSCDELKEKFVVFNYSGRWRGEKGGGGEAFAVSAVGKASTQDAGDDYSKTNVQVEGVDEADNVKNDNKYIYMIRGTSVRILNAYPPEAMKEVAKLEFEKASVSETEIYASPFAPSELYVNDSTLVIIGSIYKGKNRVKAFVYDVSDRASPKLKRSLEFDGYQISSRRIGEKLYLVLNQNAPYVEENAKPEDLLPHYLDSKTGKEKALVGCTAVRFYPRYRDPNYLIVASMSLKNPEKDPVKASVYMGAGNTVYSSIKNLYVATPRYDYDENISYNVYMPPVVRNYTVVYQFGLNEGQVTYKDQGEVPGTILNQFSMDEWSDTFRIATTTGDVWDKDNPSKNHIYILDANDVKKMVGKLENLAPGERIYSTRFVGKKGYMVTFKKIDPFFVIDLSDATNPKVLGALKIPGFSDYLHPVDENHIIGFGKNAAEPMPEETRDIDFAWYQGIKIGLFDVTDPTNPKQKFTELIGDRGTDSELLYNHKALLYDKKRNLFGFPVTVFEIPNKEPGTYTGSLQGNFVFQGAYVYTLDLEKGFELKGRITHQQDQEKLKNIENITYGWFNNEDNVTRILQIGDFLYTVSHSMLKSTGISDMQEKAKLVLEGEDEYYPGYYY